MNNPIVKNILAVIAGLAVGNIVNGLLSTAGMFFVPEGYDETKSIGENIHLFEPIHYLLPLLAHGLGTLVAAFVAVKLAATHHFRIGIGIGVFFFIMGLILHFQMLPEFPNEFKAIDLVVCYIPMGWLGWKLAKKD